MKRILALTIFIFTINAFLIHSQTPPTSGKPAVAAKVNVTLKGQVIDSLSQESIPYVTLRITESGNPAKVVKVLSTDNDGKFNAPFNVAGKFDLLINSVGKTPLVKPFEVDGTEKTVDFAKLPLSDNTVLGEVVVRAMKPLVAVDLDKITYSMQDDPDSKTSTVLDMMRKVPMITVDGEDNIQLKGSSGFKIYLDGKPSNMISSNPTQVLRSMPASMIKSVEVITDPGAKYDAEGVSGIINIITNKQPMGGYTASVGANADTRGGYGGNTFLTAKYGKLGFSGYYNYGLERNPESEFSSYREIKNSVSEKYLYQDGISDNKAGIQFGRAELSYELDTANLVSASFYRSGGNVETDRDLEVKSLLADKTEYSSYSQKTNSERLFGSTSLNVDYQRTFKKKDELLTVSYLFDVSPSDSKSELKMDNLTSEISNDWQQKYFNNWLKSNNDASDKEHTFQLDYTTPFAKIHTLEAGAKYIIRLNESSTDRDFFNSESNKWQPVPISVDDEFNYRYDILAAYLGYNLRYKDYGFKAGLRFEDTKIEAEYPLDAQRNFDNHYSTLVPSVTMTYRYKMMHLFRFGYNMRIQRPGIYHLNPYINDVDPKYITYGNPDLDVEKGHNFNFNYNVFTPKYNINASLYYNFMNNSIQSITEIKGDVSETTYGNIGEQKQVGLNLSLGWNPINNLRLNISGLGGYMDIRTNDGSGLKNSGVSGQLFGMAQYSLPKDFRLSLVGGQYVMPVSLQGEGVSINFYSLGLNKSFLSKKLNVSVNASSPFSKYRKLTFKNNNDPNFYSENITRAQIQYVRFSISYQFGELKQQAVKKTSRGISNDDVKAGESNSGTGGTQQGGTLQQ